MGSSNAQSILSRQQKIERHYWTSFSNAYSLPSGTVIHDDKPDVRIVGERTVGIEITNFYVDAGESPGSEQVQRKRRTAAVAEAQRLYIQNGGKNVELTFSFEKGCPIQDVPALAAKLASLGKRVEDLNNGKIRRDLFEDIPELNFAYLYAKELQFSDEPDPKFPNGEPDPREGFAAFRAYRNRREARALREGIYKPLSFPACWRLGQAHSFGLMSQARLQDIIDEKEAKTLDYARCDAYWLLIVVDFIDAAQEQEIRVDGLTVRSSVFEKIIVYKTGFDHIVEVVQR